ncbi:MAG TPA: SusC/RagA family TonB-linked outer membrane protein, partial [Sphingobacterium sp.]|nr:SusC/RagA family TonB-linked outer membrane protein [Sphingobacterium sp.]
MKLTALFLVLATVHISAKSFGQKVTLKEKNTTLEKIFNKISAQTGYDFLYTKKSIGKSDRASIEVENVDLSQALTQLLKEKSLKFSIEDQIIVVTKSSSASQAGSTGGENLVQTNDINGKISDRKGAPVAGATVRLKRTGQSIASNEHGIFLLKGARIGDELIVSYTGYETVTMPITSYESLTIILNETIQELDEVVLVGYGAVKRKDLTGAVSTISGKIFANMPVMRVDQMMQGRASGVDVKSSNGAPGAGTSIRIRGARSISATNEPLYVVDGLIDATNLNTLNPEDIESIDILKDASATAIYGSRAANGVVLITTKQGKANQDNTNVSTITGIQQLPKRLKLMNARQFTQFINESRLDQNRAVVYPNIDSVINIVGEKGTDWTDETMRTGIYQSYNASTSGGSEKFTYFISGNMID